MYTLNSEDPKSTIELTSNKLAVFNDLIMVTIASRLRQACEVTPLNKIVLNVPGAPLTWKLKITALDGRVWQETFTFSSLDDPDPRSTFNVADSWKRSELQPFRGFRDQLPEFIRTYDPIELKVNWL